MAMAVFAGLTLVSGLLHTADGFARGEVARPRSFALLTVAVSVLYLFGLGWSWYGRWYGDALVVLLSAVFFYEAFLVHALAVAGAQSLLGIARTSGPLFAFASFVAGASSLLAAILAGYALAKRRNRARGTHMA